MIKNCVALMVLLFLLVSNQPIFASDLKERLERAAKASGLAREQLGLAVFEQGSTAPAFALNGEKDFIPASTTKLLTAATVLERLGSSYKFQTSLYATANVQNHTLKGDLYLKGGGDSGFVSETMWFLINEFRRTGVTKIDGDVIVDDTEFDQIRADASRDPERVDRAYDAPVGAMSFNWNSINIFVRPAVAGSAPQVTLDPIDYGFKVDNKANTPTGGGNALDVSRVGQKIVVRGKVGRDITELPVFKNIDDPADWSGANLVAFLAQRGVTVTGKIKSGKTPESARLLAKADSKPVALAVSDMMKFSNNYVAEMLTKGLALQNGTRPASLEAGMQLIREYVQSVGVDSSRFTLLNPSGLSRRNQIKPIDLAKVLVQAEKNFPWFAEMLSALPLSGMDGTLKRRMKGAAAGWVRAKTGNLNGVVGLAGYAGRKDGSTRIFVFLYNGKAELCDKARHLFDGLAAELVQ